MPEAYKQLAQGSAAVGTTALYTVPATTSVIVKLITLVPAAAGTFQLKFGGRAITSAVPLAAGEFAEWDGSLALDTGKLIELVTTLATFDYTVEGVAITP
ncbi:MAG TPA: hypothetical protein VNS88_13895 [Nitrospiraceae bacterium]|nr:hypothetical protein [Nitrospiraceae bacterium]